MKQNIIKLYDFIVENSWKDGITNYVQLLFEKASSLTTDEDEQFMLIDYSLKKILSELKLNVRKKQYTNVIVNMGDYSNQDSFDFMIGVIICYYDTKFIISKVHYTTFDIMVAIMNQYKTEQTPSISDLFHLMLACLFRFHYVFVTCKKKSTNNFSKLSECKN